MAEHGDEAIITWVTTNVIARTDLSTSADLRPPDSDENSHNYFSLAHPGHGRTCTVQCWRTTNSPL